MRILKINQTLQTESPFLVDALPELLDMICETLLDQSPDNDFDVTSSRVMEYMPESVDSALWGIVSFTNTGKTIETITIQRDDK